MGRLISYDHVVEQKINTIFKEKSVHCGLIIGQCTEQKDIAIRFCATPTKDDDLQLPEAGEGNKQNKNKLSKSIDIDEQWICQHAKQLMRALPGGLDVLGFYITAPSDYTTKNQTALRQVLFAVFKILSKNRSLNLSSNERILLTLCPVTSKIMCRTYDIGDYKSSANPADWKLHSGPMRWQRVRCRLAVDIKFPIKSEDAGLSLQKQIEIGLHPFLENVRAAHALVNGTQRDLDELLDPSLDLRKSKKKANEKEVKTSLEWNDIELFIPLENNNNISNPEVCECICMMTFKGAVQCRAYVHSKATVREAITALKQDIVRSVTARCEIHCEDLLLIEEEQKDPVVVHELPRRVFAPLPQADVCVCDYQFHSDTAVDSLDAFKELLNLDLTEQDIDTSCEVSPTTSTLILPEIVEDRLSEFGDIPTHSSRSKCIPIAGAILTVVFAVFSYFMIPLRD